jgi:hypothetical protein
MKALRTGVTLLMLSTMAFGWAQPEAQKALDTFKALVGTWKGKSPRGESEEVTYSLVAGGTAVMAEMKMGGEAMTSMVYRNGDHLQMTHYCPSNNQPRMQASISPDGKTVSFEFLDATNLPDADAGHMHRAVYVFVDASHYSEEWTWRQGGKESRMHFDMQRVK